MSDLAYAPWTEDQVQSLQERQVIETMHPYTCAIHSNVSLAPTSKGWRCPMWYANGTFCKYQQSWALKADTERWWQVEGL